MNIDSENYKILTDALSSQGINLDSVKAGLKAQKIETPSWGYGNTGTRFATFPISGAARNLKEKIADAAMVNKLSGITPNIALHIPWDNTNDWPGIKDYANSLGIKIGAINPNVFQDYDYKFGSIANSQEKIRAKALAHILECVEIMKKTDSRDLSLWFADGTNYAGQDSVSERNSRIQDALNVVYKALSVDMRMLIEYKFFEPSFYHTDIADWGTAYAYALKFGPKAQVLIDTGHHAPGVNIEQIVSFLLSEGKLGGFHFNARKYADDDLIVGSVNPFELFLIFVELVLAENSNSATSSQCAKNISFMIDQSHNIEPKIEAMLQSVINCQTAFAKALIVDFKKLKELQATQDVLGAHRVLTNAFETDVRPLLKQVRTEMNIHPDPLIALKETGYEKKIAGERGITSAGAGYQI